ncbi:unknown [Anaerotruncus sp. CAG:390]|nr:unknown [Anaerotruncus sp. CAG:390]
MRNIGDEFGLHPFALHACVNGARKPAAYVSEVGAEALELVWHKGRVGHGADNARRHLLGGASELCDGYRIPHRAAYERNVEQYQQRDGAHANEYCLKQHERKDCDDRAPYERKPAEQLRRKTEYGAHGTQHEIKYHVCQRVAPPFARFYARRKRNGHPFGYRKADDDGHHGHGHSERPDEHRVAVERQQTKI